MKSPKIFAALALVAVAVIAVLLPSEPAEASAAGVAVEVAADVPAANGSFNSAGNHVYASATIADGTGTVTTITAAGTYVTVGTAAPLVAGADGVGADGSGCITYTLASNKFTIAKPCGTGAVRLRACINDVIGANSAVVLGTWHRVRASVTTIATPIARKTEPATAARTTLGCIEKVVDGALLDTYDFRYDSNTNADTVTTRNATFSVEKILN